MNDQPWVLSHPILQFTLALLLGNLCAFVAFVAIQIFDVYRTSRLHPGQLGAVAGGWNLALQSPANLLLLSIAFGIGLWLGVKLTA